MSDTDSSVVVEVDPGAGFCMGVHKAIARADELLDSGRRVYCLGHPLHNEEELGRLKQKGLSVLSPERLGDAGKDPVLVRSHGEPPETFERARELGVGLVDSTCPVVQRLQVAVREAHQGGDFVMIYGKAGHPEVLGLTGQTANRALVVGGPRDVDVSRLPEEVTLFSQTTMSVAGFAALAEWLESQGVKVRVRDTICRRVTRRIPELQSFCGRFDKVVFVGGRQSANARMLFDICRQVNPQCWFVGNEREVDADWFQAGDRVGVSGATSTPAWLMEKVAASIRKKFRRTKTSKT